MKPSDFFHEEEDPEWDLKGLDPWRRMRAVLDTVFIEELRLRPQDSVNDVEAAYGLAQLARDDLLSHATEGYIRCDDEEITAVLRSLRAVLKRLGIDFAPPFRDFRGFRGYWKSHGMKGSWSARRTYVEELFNPIFSRLEELEDIEKTNGQVRGVDGQLKNLIFASSGPKPEIVLSDVINNVIQVTKNANHCLFYDRPLTDAGLTWGELTDWWRVTAQIHDQTDQEVARSLYARLFDSVKNNPAERLVFRTYCELYRGDQGAMRPALLPQVYLHYDPLTRKQRGGQPSALVRERMDFLLLLPRRVRVVIEVDGKQHYAEGDIASPQLYSEMVAEDRRLRLQSYEVYRFGGYELMQPGAARMLRNFFGKLLGTCLLASYDP